MKPPDERTGRAAALILQLVDELIYGGMTRDQAFLTIERTLSAAVQDGIKRTKAFEAKRGGMLAAKG